MFHCFVSITCVALLAVMPSCAFARKLPCNTSAIPKFAVSPSATVLQFEDCASLSLTGLPSSNLTLQIVNSTVARWAFDTQTQLRNVHITFLQSTVLHGLFVKTRKSTNSSFALNISLVAVDCVMDFGNRSGSVVELSMTNFNSSVESVAITIRNTNLTVLCPDASRDVNMGILLVTSASKNFGPSSIANIVMVVTDSNITTRWWGLGATDNTNPPVDAVSSVMFNARGDVEDNVTNVSVVFSRNHVDGQASSRGGVLLLDQFGVAGSLDILIEDCDMTFALGGPLAAGLWFRMTNIVTISAPMYPTKIVIGGVRLLSSSVAGTSGTPWNASHPKQCGSTFASLTLANDSYVDLDIHDSLLSFVVADGMFTDFSGTVQAIVAQLGIRGRLLTGGMTINLTAHDCAVTLLISVPLCPFPRTVISVDPDNNEVTVNALTINGILLMVNAAICGLSVPIHNAHVSITSSRVNVSVPDISMCPPVSTAALFVPYYRGMPLQPIDVTFGVQQLFSVAIIIVVDEALVNSALSNTVVTGAVLQMANGADNGAFASNEFRFSYVSAVNNVVRIDTIRYHSRYNRPTNTRGIAVVFGVDMVGTRFNIADVHQSRVPLLYVFGGSTNRSAFSIRNATPFGNHEGDDNNAFNNLNWVTIFNTTMVSTAFEVIHAGPLSYPHANGSLITVSFSTIEFGSVFWNVSHAIVNNVSNALYLMDALEGNTWTNVDIPQGSALSLAQPAVVLGLQCVEWDGLPVIDNMSRLIGLPSGSVQYYVNASEKGCFIPNSIGVTSRTVALRSQMAQSAVIVSFVSSIITARSGGTAGLLASLGMTFPTDCGAVSFEGAADGNYLFLVLSGSPLGPVRGAVLSVLIVAVVLLILCMIAAGILRCCERVVTLTEGLVMLSFPGCLYGAVPWLAMPLAAAALSLLSSSGAGGVDYVIGVLGVGLTLLIVTAVVLQMCVNFKAIPRNGVVDPNRDHYHSLVTKAAWALTTSAVVWRDEKGGSHFVERYGAMFECFSARRHWYSVVDISVSVAMSIIQGLAFGVGSNGNCEVISVVFAVVEIVSILASWVLWPMNTLLDKIVLVCIGVLPLLNGTLLIVAAAAHCSSCGEAAGTVAETQLYISLTLMLAGVAAVVAKRLLMTSDVRSAVLLDSFLMWFAVVRSPPTSSRGAIATRGTNLAASSRNRFPQQCLVPQRQQALLGLIELICEKRGDSLDL